MRRTGFRLWLGALVLACGIEAEGAVRSAEASVSATEVMTGEAFQLRIQVIADGKEELPWPRVAGLEPFTVSRNRGTSTSSQTTILNGKVSRSEQFVTEFAYTLTPREPGTFTIGPLRYVHRDFDRDLGSAVVTVVRAEAGLETRSSVSKSTAYAGEQVLYTLRIIPGEGVQSINLPQDPQKLIGQKFFFQQLDRETAPTTALIDGREARVFDIRIALFPLLTGTAVLEGIPVEYRRIRPGRSQVQSMFDMFEEAFFGGGGRLVTQTATAAPLRMRVLPLPQGAPAGFTGAVGRYTVAAALDKPAVAAGDAVTLTVTIRGNGLPKAITRPLLPELSAFEVYDPEETVVTRVEGAVLWTEKTFRYVLVPHREGEHALSGIAFPYFDAGRERFDRAEAPSLALRVTPGSGASALAQRPGIGNPDLRPIRTGDFRLRDDARLPYRHPAFAVLLLLPPLAFAAALAARRRRDRLRSDPARYRRARAGSQLRRRLKTVRAALAEGRGREFYRALSGALESFAGDRLNLEVRGLTRPEVLAHLAGRGAAPETTAAWEALLQRCDFMQFTGAAPSAEEMRRDLAEGERLLARLDRELS